MATQKEIASQLDRGASRSGNPATRKQCWFLAKLLSERNATGEAVGCDTLNTSCSLSKEAASQYINEILGGVEGLGTILPAPVMA